MLWSCVHYSALYPWSTWWEERDCRSSRPCICCVLYLAGSLVLGTVVYVGTHSCTHSVGGWTSVIPGPSNESDRVAVTPANNGPRRNLTRFPGLWRASPAASQPSSSARVRPASRPVPHNHLEPHVACGAKPGGGSAWAVDQPITYQPTALRSQRLGRTTESPPT